MSPEQRSGGWRLAELLEGVVPEGALHQQRLQSVVITALACDSREVRPGALFLARRGRHDHGTRFIADALARGAAAVLYDPDGAVPLPPDTARSVPLLAVTQLTHHLGTVADRFHQHMTRRLFTAAVTGTNGKTTVSWLVAHALHASGRHAGLIGTLGNGLADNLTPGNHTTPHACEIHNLLAEFRQQGARAMVMEASSHGIHQGRLNRLDLDVAVFTNLTRDHLDYHGDMEAYGQAKERLFHHPHLRAAVINADDPWGRRILAGLPASVQAWCYTLGTEIPELTTNAGIRRVRARCLESSADGLVLEVITPQGEGRIESPYLGRFNASNLLAALAVLECAGLSLDEACRCLAAAPAVPGRMARVNHEAPVGQAQLPTVVVDYAHTPDALENALSALRPHCRGNLIVVFGCGGERDHGKRPQMGAVAAAVADHVWLTDDNPRSEVGDRIIADIRAGIPAGVRVSVERDRAAAIEAAVWEARAGDVVLVAGKGHETYQQIGSERRHFNDAEQAHRALARRAEANGSGGR